jgi:hypothetical protein
MPDVDRVFEIERCGQFREIVGTDIDLVTIPRLAGTCMAATVMCNTAESTVREKQLVFKGVSTECPPMAEEAG